MVKGPKRSCLSFQVEEDRRNEESGKNKEDVHAHPSELWELKELASKYFVMAGDHKTNGYPSNAVQFPDAHIAR